MSKQEVMERLDTETRTSVSHTYNTDAFRTLGSGKGRTLRTIANSAPASIAVTGSSTSHNEMIRSGHLTHHSSSMMQIRRTNGASPNTVATAKFETVTLRISSPKIPIASFSDVNHSATGSSHHIDSRWKAESTTSDLQNKNKNSSNTTNSSTEGPPLFLTENITMVDAVSQREITSSPVHPQFPSQAIHSRRRSSTKAVTQLAESSEGTVLNHSYFSSKTSDGKSSVTERDVSISHNDSMPVSVLSEGDGERTLRTPRDVSHSHNATQLSKTSSNPVHTSQMDLLPGDTVYTEAEETKYEAPSGTTAVEDSVLLRTTSNSVGSIPSSHMDSVSAPGLSEKSGETMLRTLIDISNSHKTTTQISTTNSDEISTSSELPDSSYALTPVQSREMDLSLNSDFTEEADSLQFTEEAVALSSETTADEDSGQPNSSSDTDGSVYSSHMESASVPDLFDRDGKRTLKTPGDTSSSQSATQIPTNSSNEISTSSGFPDSSSVLNPVQTSQMDLSPEGTDFFEAVVTETQVSSKTMADEDIDPLRNTERGVSSSHMESASPPGLFDRSGQRTLRTLRDVGTSHSATQISTTTSDEISSSSSLFDSSYALTLVQTRQKDLSPGDTDFTEKAVTPYQDPSETTAAEDTGLLNSASNTESVSISHMDSTSVLGVSDSGEEKTLHTLIDGSSSYKSLQISTASGVEISSLLGLTDYSSVLTPVQTRGMDLSPGDMDFTEATRTHSQTPSEVTDVKDLQPAISHSSVEKTATQTESVFSAANLATSGNGTIGSLTNWTKSTDTTKLSAFDLEDVSSSDLTLASSTTVLSEKEGSLFTGRDFTKSLKQSVFTYSSNTSLYSFSTTDLSSTRNNLQTDQGSVAERRLPSASTDSLYLSTTSTHSGERTMRSLPDDSTSFPDNSTSPDVVDTPTYDTETSKSSYPALTSKSVAETERYNVSLSQEQSTGPYPALTSKSVAETKRYNVSLSQEQSTGPSTEHSLEHSSLIPMYSSLPKDSSTIGSDQHLVNGSEVSYSYTESTYTSALLSKGEEGMGQSTINTTFREVTESISLYMEKSNSSELTPSSPNVDSTRIHVDSVDFGTSEPSTETFQTLSLSRIPTSFQSETSDTGTGYQPMSSTDTGKRTSVSHTDSTYISTTFTRGGERTLLSISQNSTLATDSLESSTFYTETSSPSESLQSSFPVNQSRESSMSSGDMDFPVPSTEPLAAYTPQTPEYSSTVNKPHINHFYSTSDPASASSLSFTSSSPTSLKQDSLPPTQPPRLFASSESSLPSFSSSFPSPFSLTPKTPLITFSHRLSSTALPLLPSLLPSVSSSSSLLQSSEDLETSVPMTTSEETTGVDSRTSGISFSEYNNQTRTDPSKDSRVLSSTELSPLMTETTEQLTSHSSPVIVSLEETKGSKRENTSLPGTSVEKTLPILTTSPTYVPESTTGYKVTKATAPPLPKATTPKVEVTTGKKHTDITYTTLRLPTLASSTDALTTTKTHKVLPFSTTKLSHTTEMPTKGIEKSSVTSAKEHVITTTEPPPITISSSKTTAETFFVSPVSTKATTNAWSGSLKTFPTSHGKDVDECLSNPCPVSATCTNTQGSFKCTCSLGYWMEKGKCNLVRTFVGQFPLTFNTSGGKYSELHQVEEDIINMLNASLSTLPGYYTSSIKASRQAHTIQVSVLSTFSLLSNVTLYDIVTTIRSHIRACKAPTETCQFISNLTLLHRAGGLCKHKDPECDKETSVCVDLDGIAACRCRPGYFKYNKLDHSCRGIVSYTAGLLGQVFNLLVPVHKIFWRSM
ncbi:hypothetical protein JD844_022465 [Phrynosoma platyrhinos]|uniref:EGF-like domain-containing protein n=1 Tax=Phrynosoma platyrhinos TaxID=52577 RepID=A0ABQ7SVG5_PHRPL|nr:hypothetical protein JD844_022465 [Phrynosoma platyrhinos]